MVRPPANCDSLGGGLSLFGEDFDDDRSLSLGGSFSLAIEDSNSTV